MKLNPALIEKLQVNLNDTKRHEGINAKEWAKYFIDHNSINPLLNRSYNRDDLIKLRGNDKYSDQDVCIAILSWGGMNREHARKFFSSKEMWVPIVNSLRHGQIEKRDEAYRLFKNLKSKGGLPGMGPAFYTKLIAFVNPDLDGYIMDQWVAKSVNLLLDNDLVRLNTQGIVLNKNTSEIYETYCTSIEEIAKMINLKPLYTEEALFSYGGHHKGAWRKFIISIWQKELNTSHRQNRKQRKKMIYMNMHPIEFSEAIAAFKHSSIQVNTLGGGSNFGVFSKGSNLEITTTGDSVGVIDKEHWDKVMIRMKELPMDERRFVGRYGHGDKDYSWNEAPNRIFTPYVPAIVKYLIESNN